MSIRYPLETVRLRLEPFQETDGDALYTMESDPEVKRYAGGILTRQQTQKMLNKFVVLVRETGYGPIAIKLRETNTIIGLCGFYATDVPQEAEIFYGFARDAWGKGYATEACKALLEAGIVQLGLTHVIAPVHPQNLRSIRVLEKIGMSFSGVTTSTDLYEVAHVYSFKASPVP